jgi:stage II sporulation protein R
MKRNMMKRQREWKGWKRWELALLLALCLALLSGLWARERQHALAERLIRLHVIASSDSPEDQAVKLEVRDGVLALLTPALEGAKDASAAEQVIEGLLPELAETASSISGIPARATLDTESYPTRRYDGFALPAGEYRSLRVTLGEGGGRNWWCVVFPPLCIDAAQVSAGEAANLTESDVRLITESDGGYVLRFRLLELWGELMNRLT